ncbi:MAG: HAD-IB family phosphatase [Leptolyngbyaceae bacterium]|nr:HAD-IB family phosphatase [Leptolyngbyaceae bacterium]
MGDKNVSRMVFCDFDGTITAQETFVAMLRHFVPDRAAVILPQIYHQAITLKQGVRLLLEDLPASVYGDIVEFTRPQPIRPGFGSFLSFLEAHQTPFVVVSGGLQGMVEAVLEPFLPQVKGIHAIAVDTAGPRLGLRSPYEGDTEMVAKADILAHYQNTYGVEETIAIGDGITDWNMALAASLVFARPPLTDFMEKQGKAYIAWDTFTDIQAYLTQYFAT